MSFAPPPSSRGCFTDPNELTLITVDKFGNDCQQGGAYVTARLSGQGIPAGQESELECTDLGTGQYTLKITLRAPAEVKVIVAIAREKPSGTQVSMPGAVSEMAPVHLAFVSLKAQQMKEDPSIVHNFLRGEKLI